MILLIINKECFSHSHLIKNHFVAFSFFNKGFLILRTLSLGSLAEWIMYYELCIINHDLKPGSVNQLHSDTFALITKVFTEFQLSD